LDISSLERPDHSRVSWIRLAEDLPQDREMLLVVHVQDRAGNRNVTTSRFWLSETPGVVPEGVPARPVADVPDLPDVVSADEAPVPGAVDQGDLAAAGPAGNTTESSDLPEVPIADVSEPSSLDDPATSEEPLLTAAPQPRPPAVPDQPEPLFDPISSEAPQVSPPARVDSSGDMGSVAQAPSAPNGSASETGSPGAQGSSDGGTAGAGSVSTARTGCSAATGEGDPAALIVLLIPFVIGLLRKRTKVLGARVAA